MLLFRLNLDGFPIYICSGNLTIASFLFGSLKVPERRPSYLPALSPHPVKTVLCTSRDGFAPEMPFSTSFRGRLYTLGAEFIISAKPVKLRNFTRRLRASETRSQASRNVLTSEGSG